MVYNTIHDILDLFVTIEYLHITTIYSINYVLLLRISRNLLYIIGKENHNKAEECNHLKLINSTYEFERR